MAKAAMTTQVEVTRADRNAAADLNHVIATDETLSKLCEGGPLPLVPARLLLPAFARHRLTAEQAKDAEIADLRALLREAREALEDCANPMRVLQREADAAGARLNGNAAIIANQASFIKSIARTILAKGESK